MDYEKLYKAYYMRVYSYVITLTRNPDHAEEIAQHTFVKAMSTKAKHRGQSGEFTWLCTIAKNLYYDEIRRHQKLTGIEDADRLSSGDDLEKIVTDADMTFRIHLILHDLEEPYKEVFGLRVFGELTFAQIASIFGKTESWARVTYHRARLKIQERMG